MRPPRALSLIAVTLFSQAGTSIHTAITETMDTVSAHQAQGSRTGPHSPQATSLAAASISSTTPASTQRTDTV